MSITLIYNIYSIYSTVGAEGAFSAGYRGAGCPPAKLLHFSDR